MKRLAYPLFATLLFLTACQSGEEKKLKAFTQHFVTSVVNGNHAEVTRLYPDATLTEALAVSFDADSFRVETVADKDNEYIVGLGSGKSLRVVRNEADSFLITASYGLFAFPQDKLKLGMATGWIEKGMTDKQMAERFSDTAFMSSLLHQFVADLKKHISVRISGGWGNDYAGDMWVSSKGLTLSVRNDSPYDIPANAYNITCREWYWGTPSQKISEVVAGAALAHNSTATLQTKRIGSSMESENDAAITFNEDALSGLFVSVAKFTGNEYKDYLSKKQPSTASSNTAQPGAETKSSGTLPNLRLTGTIGGATDGVFTYNAATGEGTVTFTVSGARNERQIKFGSYDAASGQLVIQEYFTGGQYIGDFVGTYRNGTYKGIFTNKTSGGKVDFNLH